MKVRHAIARYSDPIIVIVWTDLTDFRCTDADDEEEYEDEEYEEQYHPPTSRAARPPKRKV